MPTRMNLPGPLCAAWIARDSERLSPSYTRAYSFVMSHGRGAQVWDLDGNEFLDFCAGIAVCATGHSHPDVVQAISRQAAKFIHMSGTDFYYPQQTELAERLNDIAPIRGPTRTFFTNSGTESIEAAFKLARCHSGRPRAIAFLGGFHGRTMGALSLTGSKAVQRRGFAPLVPGVTHVPYGYCYRCAFGLEHPSCDLYCVRYIEDTVLRSICPPDEVAAVFVEPIQGEGGYVVPPPGYFLALRALCDRYDILLVVDEVQSGFGRSGKMFAIEHWNVEPDIIAVAKGIASGLPLGAMVARQSVVDWEPGSHGTTFGGNPVACAASMATLDLLDQGLVDRAASLGAAMLARLQDLKQRYACIGDVRGKGLMMAIELVKDRETKEPAAELRAKLVTECYLRGLLVLGCGRSSVRFSPALVIRREQVSQALSILDDALAACGQGN